MRRYAGQRRSAASAARRVPFGCACVVSAALAASSTAPRFCDAASTVFAVISDYGQSALPYEGDVAARVRGWSPEFIATAGDNNLPSGAAETIDANIGRHYHAYIRPYKGSFGPGAAENLFFPALGNHDWGEDPPVPYLDYFSLPWNERYYDVARGPVRLFILDSDSREPDGVSPSSAQGVWLRERLAAAGEPWKLVVFHHPPFSSGTVHGSTAYMQWPYREWGATATISGHDHGYERIVRDGFPYFVAGLGGQSRSGYGFVSPPVDGSAARYNADHGAMRLYASDARITFQFVTRGGDVVDSYALLNNAPARIDLNGVSFGTGSPFTAEFLLSQSVRRPFVAYAAVILPDGSMRDAATLRAELEPAAPPLPSLGAPFARAILSGKVPSDAPKGTYEIVAAFFEPSARIAGRGDAFLDVSEKFTVE